MGSPGAGAALLRLLWERGQRWGVLSVGSNSPSNSTDSAAALRANEIGADVLLKGTNVRGVYAEDPNKNPNAEFFEKVSFDQVLRLNLKVMDAAAFALCRDNELRVRVFNMNEAGNIHRALGGEELGTLVTN